MKTLNAIVMMFTVVMLYILGMAQASAGEFLNMWYQNRLFAPNELHLQQEQKGKVVIYDGMRDTEVNQAMDMHFDRIDSMMFIGTIITDDMGKPKVDKATGLVLTEDDDC